MGTKPDFACQQHYTNGYLKSPIAPLPMVVAHPTSSSSSNSNSSSSSNNNNNHTNSSGSASASAADARRGSLGSSTPAIKLEHAGDSAPSTQSHSQSQSQVQGQAPGDGMEVDEEGASASASSRAGTTGVAASTGGANAKQRKAGTSGSGGVGPSSSSRAGLAGHFNATPGYPNAHVPRTEIAGYFPLRGDFDVEYDNGAEAILADMEFVEVRKS